MYTASTNIPLSLEFKVHFLKQIQILKYHCIDVFSKVYLKKCILEKKISSSSFNVE